MKILRFALILPILLILSGCTGISVAVNSSDAENLLRNEFYSTSQIAVVVECPDDMSGVSGDRFTCYMCPESYTAAESGGGYFYGDGSTEFRCDAAYEGFAVEYVIEGSDFTIDWASIRGANPSAPGTSGASGSTSSSSDLEPGNEVGEYPSAVELIAQWEDWAVTISLEQWSDFQGYMEGCTTFACGTTDVRLSSNSAPDSAWLDLVFLDSGQVVGRSEIFMNPGDISALSYIDLSGIRSNGTREYDVEIYHLSQGIYFGSTTVLLNSQLSPIEEFFSRHPENFDNAIYGSDVQLSDPLDVAEELIAAGVCENVSSEGSSARCSRSLDKSPAYDAYIVTRPSDIVSMSLGRTADHTVFFAPTWAVAVYYPAWNASDTDIVERMAPLRWEVLGQDDTDPKNCIGSCFVARDQ